MAMCHFLLPKITHSCLTCQRTRGKYFHFFPPEVVHFVKQALNTWQFMSSSSIAIPGSSPLNWHWRLFWIVDLPFNKNRTFSNKIYWMQFLSVLKYTIDSGSINSTSTPSYYWSLVDCSLASFLKNCSVPKEGDKLRLLLFRVIF